MTNGTLDHIEVNMSNKEFHPAKMPSKILKHVAVLAPTDDVPHFAAAKGSTEVPGALLNEIAWENATLTVDSHMTMFALPMSVLGGFGKDFVEGLATERDVLNTLANEYGEDLKTWAQMMISALDLHSTIQRYVLLHAP